MIAAPSWSSLRDMLALGQVVAAHMLAPVPIATAVGLCGAATRLETLMVLNLNGNTIGVSRELTARMRANSFGIDFVDAWAAGLALLAEGSGLRIGLPFAFSMHRDLIHYWPEGLGQALPEGLEIYTVPPPLMAKALAAGGIDAICVGKPRGSVGVETGAGELLLPGSAIWAAAPEKVLATRAGWAETKPELAGRLIRALWRASRWLGQGANHSVAADVLSAPGRLAVGSEVIKRVLTGWLPASSTRPIRCAETFGETKETSGPHHRSG